MTSTCPSCFCIQPDGILCSDCTEILRKELNDVPSVVRELDNTISRQAKILVVATAQERPETAEDETVASGLVHERLLIHLGAIQAADDLANALVYWARDISRGRWSPVADLKHATAAAAGYLRGRSETVRSRANVAELFDGVLSAIRHARNMTDQPAERTIHVGPCPEDHDGTPCQGQVYAYLPTSSDKPPHMTCRAHQDHTWTTSQWLRAGQRILALIEKRRQVGAA